MYACARHLALAVPLSMQVYKWALSTNAGGNPAMKKHLIHGIEQILVAFVLLKTYFCLDTFFSLLGQWLSAVAFW